MIYVNWNISLNCQPFNIHLNSTYFPTTEKLSIFFYSVHLNFKCFLNMLDAMYSSSILMSPILYAFVFVHITSRLLLTLVIKNQNQLQLSVPVQVIAWKRLLGGWDIKRQQLTNPCLISDADNIQIKWWRWTAACCHLANTETASVCCYDRVTRPASRQRRCQVDHIGLR